MQIAVYRKVTSPQQPKTNVKNLKYTYWNMLKIAIIFFCAVDLNVPNDNQQKQKQAGPIDMF